MAHKPTVPCTDCGKLRWHHTKTSSTQPTCRPCRAARRLAAPAPEPKKPRRGRQCEICGAAYRPTYTAQRSCGRKCGLALRRRIGSLPPEPRVKAAAQPRTFACVVCGVTGETTNRRQKLCGRPDCARESSRVYMNAHYERYKDQLVGSAHRRRAMFKAQFVEDVSLTVLYARDQGRCGICRGEVPEPGATKAKRDPRMASIDHVVPISEGGEHSYANTRLAHYRCNLMRSNRGGNEQLALIG